MYISHLFKLKKQICSVILFISSFLYYYPMTSYNNYNFIHFDIIIKSTIISFLINSLFYYLDITYDKSIWSSLGKKLNNNESNMVILHKYNAHSSISQFFVGIYTLLQLDNTLYYSSLFFSISLLSLGIASYLHWSTQTIIMYRLDHIFMDMHINSLTILFISSIYEILEIKLIIVTILWTIYRFTKNKRALLFEPSLLAIFSSLFCIYIQNNSGNVNAYIGGLFIIFSGLIFKILDSCYGFSYGTAIFHFLEASGFLILYYWIKTV